ncbi:arginine/serine-rich protein PNISR-like isoform X1 [Pieris brassicae]|uniref:arginine/serine-rich protein PNISR-like isoform X1 n=1 Tax=Pieris brassicae TaxID=7116 RepID=UPI001E65FA4B|nr:arginine/serine-rich protein PNISR-like isoform X1 [Pieris brassicae]XP_045532425.1 arginine/serine-rich protein PNISR-like isoform X1 [Pieris brassicae]
MFPGKDAANSAYPTQWALNPTAYQNIDASQVDWAALAQQWIAMKDAVAIVGAPPAKIEPEGGEAPMEVENPSEATPGPPGAEWNASTNSWTGNSWSQWGWNWPGSGPIDPKVAVDPVMAMGPIMEGYTVPENASPMPGYTTGAVPTPTFQHGYWTAPSSEQGDRIRGRSSERRSKSKGHESRPPRSRSHRDKPTLPPIIEPVAPPVPPPTTLDAAKRRQLPGWIREGLEKMEREKQRAIEREQEEKAREEAEAEKKKLELEALQRMKAEGAPLIPAKSKFDSDSEAEESEKEELIKPKEETLEIKEEIEPEMKRSKEEIMQEVMLAVRRSLTEILLEVTDQEIQTVSQEELARYTSVQGISTHIGSCPRERLLYPTRVTDSNCISALLKLKCSATIVNCDNIATLIKSYFRCSPFNEYMYCVINIGFIYMVKASRLNTMKASQSKAFTAISSGLGLGAYESSSDSSGDEGDVKDVTDHQLQEIIRRRRLEFERTSREIEAEVRRAELRETGEATPSDTPDKHRRTRSSVTPPPIDGSTPEKKPDHRLSRDKRSNHKISDKVDGVRKLETIEEKQREGKHSRSEKTPSPLKNAKTSSSSNSDSSSSSSNSSDSEPEVVETRPKKRKRIVSSSSESQKKSKHHKKEKHKNDKSPKSKETKKDKHKKDDRRKDCEEEKPKRRSKRSTSIGSGKRRSRDKSEERSFRRDKNSYDRDSKRDRSYDRHDRESKRDRSYDKSGRDYDRDSKRERSHDRSRDYERSDRDSKRDRSYDKSSRGYERSDSKRDRDRSRDRHGRDYDKESRHRDKSYDRSGRDYIKSDRDRRDRSYDKYDRRDYERRRSRSTSHYRHRR